MSVFDNRIIIFIFKNEVPILIWRRVYEQHNDQVRQRSPLTPRCRSLLSSIG